jgi:peptidoglycan hydrolase-like protein with peptidoglycan-binding domain
VQARLNNLGYDCGKVDAVIGKKTKTAIHAFKKNNGLADDDVLDNATRDKLKNIYGL